jgi:DnaD/phage-associated family protein
MANPQPTDAHLRIAHSISEAIMMRDFSKRQRKILDLILRLSYGCGKKTAIIPNQRDFEIVGIREGHIKRELDWLIESKVITRTNDQYQFNKDFDSWQVSRVKPYQPLKLTKLVRLNLPPYQNSKPKLTKIVSPTLPKQEVPPYQNSKLATPKLDTAKTTTKKITKKSNNNNNSSSKELSSLIKIYEQEKFGEMTPFIESELQAALKEFGAEKIKEAFKIAVRANKRKWSYVTGILENWRAKNADKKFGKWGARVSLRGAVYRAQCKEAGVSFTEKGEKQNEILARASSMSDEELLAEAERLKL